MQSMLNKQHFVFYVRFCIITDSHDLMRTTLRCPCKQHLSKITTRFAKTPDPGPVAVTVGCRVANEWVSVGVAEPLDNMSTRNGCRLVLSRR